MHTRRQRQAGNTAFYCGNRHSIEDIVECFELEPAAGSLGDDTDSYATKNRPQILDETQEAGCSKMLVRTQVGRRRCRRSTALSGVGRIARRPPP